MRAIMLREKKNLKKQLQGEGGRREKKKEGVFPTLASRSCLHRKREDLEDPKTGKVGEEKEKEKREEFCERNLCDLSLCERGRGKGSQPRINPQRERKRPISPFNWPCADGEAERRRGKDHKKALQHRRGGNDTSLGRGEIR